MHRVKTRAPTLAFAPTCAYEQSEFISVLKATTTRAFHQDHCASSTIVAQRRATIKRRASVTSGTRGACEDVVVLPPYAPIDPTHGGRLRLVNTPISLLARATPEHVERPTPTTMTVPNTKSEWRNVLAFAAKPCILYENGFSKVQPQRN